MSQTVNTVASPITLGRTPHETEGGIPVRPGGEQDVPAEDDAAVLARIAAADAESLAAPEGYVPSPAEVAEAERLYCSSSTAALQVLSVDM